MWETVDFGFIPNFFLRLSIDWSAEKTNKQTNECDPVPGDHSGEEALRLRSGTADLAGQTLAGSLRQSNDILHRWSFINVHSFLILRFVRSFLHDRVLTGAVRVVCVCVCVCVCGFGILLFHPLKGIALKGKSEVMERIGTAGRGLVRETLGRLAGDVETAREPARQRRLPPRPRATLLRLEPRQ